jgi:glutaredoxin 3
MACWIMAVVVIFTKHLDPYSIRAKKLLEMKGVGYTEKQLPEHAAEMERLTASKSTPQIIINGSHIGSYEQLSSLELQGKLDALLR